MATEVETEIWSDVPRRGKEKKGKAALAGVLSGQEPVELPGAVVEPERQAGQEAIGEASSVESGGLTEVTIVRICANPRMLLCEYAEGLLTCQRILVRVPKSNTFFRRGMKLRARRSAREGEPWVYEGRMPRFAGRW
jgi:hypothetical protein